MGKKLVFYGAGSPYVPAIVYELINCSREIQIDEVVFIAKTDKHLSIIADFCEGLFNQKSMYPKIRKKTNMDESIKDADIIFLIYRVGTMKARKFDETIGINLNVISQESQGVGGFSSALRHIALLQQISGIIKMYAPNAWVINLTNPTGIMTCASERLGLKTIGVCDAPYDLSKKISKYVACNNQTIQYDYVGLNHLGWMIDVKCNDCSLFHKVFDEDILPSLLKELLNQNNIVLTNTYINFVRSLGAIPSAYVSYYYHRNLFIKRQHEIKKVRAEVVNDINNQLYLNFLNKMYSNWPDFFKQSRSGYLLGEALAQVVFDLLGPSSEQRHIICTRNGNAIDNLSSDAVIEMPVKVIDGKIVPIYNKKTIHGNMYSLIAPVSEYETMTVVAGLSGNYDIALQAISSHPLIPNIDVAEKLLNQIIKDNSDFINFR